MCAFSKCEEESMRIGIDIDGVLTNYENFIKAYGTKYSYENNISMQELDFTQYDEKKAFHWTKEQYRDFWTKYLLWYATKYLARENASEVLQILKNEGHKIYIITARNNEELPDDKKEQMKQIVKQWLEENHILYDQLIFSGESKLSVCMENKIEIMVDDSPFVLEEVGKCIPVICFDAEYNKNIKGMERIHSWYELLNKIHDFDNTK